MKEFLIGNEPYYYYVVFDNQTNHRFLQHRSQITRQSYRVKLKSIAT